MKRTHCLDCGCAIPQSTGWRCENCAKAHKKKKHAEYLARAEVRKQEEAARHAAWLAEAPAREAAWKIEEQKREEERHRKLLKERSPDGNAARRTKVDQESSGIKRGAAGTHSWAILKVKELDDGELFPVRWRCRDCGTVKTIESTIRPVYVFPDGHERHFDGALPEPGRSGYCPYGVPSSKKKSWRDWGEP